MLAPVGAALRRSQRPQIRSRAMIWGFAFTAAVGFALVNVVDPYSGSVATPAYADTLQDIEQNSRYGDAPVQSLTAPDASSTTVTRDVLGVELKPTPTPTPTQNASSSGGGSAPSAPTPDPGSAKALAYQMVQARGWGEDQYSCLVALWNRESGWRVNASNPSGAYGIPQALPGSKMGPGWQTDMTVQISWGIGYIQGRYTNPCGAWDHSESRGWY